MRVGGFEGMNGCSKSSHCYDSRYNVTRQHRVDCEALFYGCEAECLSGCYSSDGPRGMTVQDFQGYHNSDLGATSARLITAGTWKKQRVIVLMPASFTIPSKVALSLWNLAFPPNNDVFRFLIAGAEVGEAYSTAIANILADPNLSQWEYVLTVEHDNLLPSNAVMKMIEDMEAHPEYSVISGSYFTKGPEGVWQGWGDPREATLNFRPQVPTPDTLQEVCGTGMGAALWRLSMFKDERLRRPWFKTLSGESGCMTQDLYFWQDARKYGYRCAVDTRIKVGHYDLDGKFGIPDFAW